MSQIKFLNWELIAFFHEDSNEATRSRGAGY